MAYRSNHASTSIWAMVLAAGDGTRLRSLTCDASGRSTPKQYCSLLGGPSLLEDALQRGRRIADPGRVAAIVSAHHEPHWRGALEDLDARNIVSQPENRGTAHGVLLATLAVLNRDPDAVLLFLPADHDVVDETRLADAMRSAVEAVVAEPASIALVGIEPDEPDPELGYIVPGAARGETRAVERFVEKPARAVAEKLLGVGALWNSFIFSVSGKHLVELYRTRLPGVVARMAEAVESGDESALAGVYAMLESVDFSHDILTHATGSLRVVAARACGWSDLGTPRRVDEAARRVRSTPPRRLPTSGSPGLAAMNLSAMLAMQQLSA